MILRSVVMNRYKESLILDRQDCRDLFLRERTTFAHAQYVAVQLLDDLQFLENFQFQQSKRRTQ